MKHMKVLLSAVVWLVGLFGTCEALAHDMGDGAHITTLISEQQDAEPTFAWALDITIQELVSQFPQYDVDENGRITPLEYGAIDAREVVGYLLPKLKLVSQAGKCDIRITSYTIEQHKRADYIHFPLQVECAGDIDRLTLDYALFFEQNPYHQGTWTVVFEQQPNIQYFWEDARTRSFTVKKLTYMQVFASFLAKGIHHIAIGFDHILFLISLLLPAVLMRKGRRWLPTDSVSQTAWNVTKIITVFTLAHSVTLTLAVLRLVPLPPAVWVESIIALSIVVMALHNIYPLFRFDVLLITFVFGLIHGFGFANVLLEYPLSDQGLVVSLLAFNLGVESGQLMIALLLMPLLFYCRKAGWYGRVFLPLASGVIGLIGVYWLIERLMG